MRFFITRSILFLSVLLIYFAINFLINSFFVSKNVPIVKGTTVIMGDSHTMTGIDPSMLNSADNISQSAEPYIITYFKLKEILKHNAIDTVLLGFSYQNISAFNDDKFYNSRWCDELFSRTYSLIPLSRYKGYNVNQVSYYRAFIKNMLLIPKRNHNIYMGGFDKRGNELEITKNKPSAAIKRHFFKNRLELPASTLSIQYLDSIKDLTENKHIKLILVNTPLHPAYAKLIPLNIVSTFDQVKNKAIHEGIMIVDYAKTSMPDNCFADFDHLNHKGAKIFSQQIKLKIKSQ